MSKKTLMIVNAILNVSEQEAFKYYSEKSAPLFKEVGAKPVAKYKVAKTIIGTKKTQVVSILEFPNSKVINDVFESKAYKELLLFRDKAFTELDVFIAN